MKRHIGVSLAALAIAALPPSAWASPTARIDHATANPEWTHASFAGSVNYDVCGQRYPCRWSAVVTAQRSQPSRWCQRPVPGYTSPDVMVIAAIERQAADAPVSFEGESVPILPGVEEQEICIFLRDQGVLHFDPYGDLRDFPWPGPCELDAPVEVACTDEVRIACPQRYTEAHAASNLIQPSKSVDDAPPGQPAGVVSMLLDYVCALGPAAPITVAARDDDQNVNLPRAAPQPQAVGTATVSILSSHMPAVRAVHRVVPSSRAGSSRFRRCGTVVGTPTSGDALTNIKSRAISCKRSRRALRNWMRDGYVPLTGPHRYRCKTVKRFPAGNGRERCVHDTVKRRVIYFTSGT